jgi:ubiquinone/menaquinone biosynthesis C-methylase UbiE
MSKLQVADHLKSSYQHHYEREDAEWRRVGALAKADNIVALSRSLPHDSVLEIGAGDGAVLQRLSELGFGRELYALEISSSGLEKIRERRIPRLVEGRLFDGYRVPYDDVSFDIAVLSHVIEHVEHPRQLLYEASRVAKTVFVEVPLEDTVRLPDDFELDDVGHINAYSLKTIRRLLQSCNLRVLGEAVGTPAKAVYVYQQGTAGAVNYLIKKSLLRLAPRLATALFTYHAAFVCENTVVTVKRVD